MGPSQRTAHGCLQFLTPLHSSAQERPASTSLTLRLLRVPKITLSAQLRGWRGTTRFLILTFLVSLLIYSTLQISPSLKLLVAFLLIFLWPLGHTPSCASPPTPELFMFPRVQSRVLFSSHSLHILLGWFYPNPCL